METIKNYIRYFKDITFEESPFNDVDNVILSSIVYLDFEGLVNKPITLKELGKKYFNNIDYKELKSQTIMARRTADNFELLFNGDRYKDIIVSNYKKVVDNEKQFCAVKFKTDSFTYIAYEGTDDSIVGWKEDFQMIYKFPVPAQKMAIDYLNKTVKFSDKNLMVGGHSKGGNLAMTAAMKAKSHIKRKITKVYNNDGPGFRLKEIKSNDYKEMLPKLKTFIPEESIIGILLRHPDNMTVIKSSGKGIFQHNSNNWQCYGPILIQGNLSEGSKDLDAKVKLWLDRHDDTKRKQMVDTIFDTLEKSGITLVKHIKQFKLSKMIKLIKLSKNIDKESKDLVVSATKVLLFKDDSFID